MKTAKKEKVVATEKKDTKKVAPKIKPELISYSMKMVIPTGQYANIQPEIIVRAGTVEEAHDYIAPHFNKLWKEYFMCSERRPEPVVKPVGQPIVSPATTPAPVVTPEVVSDSPVSSVAFTKASQAITSCLSLDALEIIRKQIGASVKLTDEDKVNLVPVLEAKLKELNGKVNPA